jgi:regulatory protein
MQLALNFPQPLHPVNNRAMSSDDADKVEAAKKLRNKALRLLTTREHSREELLRKLAQAKVARARGAASAPKPDKDDIRSLVDDLTTQGWQSDDRYADAIVRRLSGQASRRFISEKLAQSGIKKDVAALALEALEENDATVALALWTRRFGVPPTDDKERQRQIRFLLSRGFHLGDAFKLVPAPAIDAIDFDALGDVGLRSPASSPIAGGTNAPVEFTRSSESRTSTPGKARSSFGRSRPWGRKNDRDTPDPGS